MKKIIDGFGKLSAVLSGGLNVAAAVILLIMMFTTAVDVFLRYVFQSPIPGSYELTEFAVVLVVFLAVAYTQLNKRHIRIEFIVSMLPQKAQAIIDCFIYLLALIFFTLAVWQGLLHAQVVSSQVSGTLRIPIAPFVSVVVAGNAVLCFVLLVDFIKSITTVVNK